MVIAMATPPIVSTLQSNLYFHYGQAQPTPYPDRILLDVNSNQALTIQTVNGNGSIQPMVVYSTEGQGLVSQNVPLQVPVLTVTGSAFANTSVNLRQAKTVFLYSQYGSTAAGSASMTTTTTTNSSFAVVNHPAAAVTVNGATYLQGSLTWSYNIQSPGCNLEVRAVVGGSTSNGKVYTITIVADQPSATTSLQYKNPDSLNTFLAPEMVMLVPNVTNPTVNFTMTCFNLNISPPDMYEITITEF